MTKMTKWTAQNMGRKGGSARSEAKAAAVRENGRKGGRPPYTYKPGHAAWYCGEIVLLPDCFDLIEDHHHPKSWRLQDGRRVRVDHESTGTGDIQVKSA